MTEPVMAAPLRELARVAQAMGPAIAPSGSDQLLHAITRTARELFGAAACSLALLSDDESELVFTTVSGAGEDRVSGMRIDARSGIAGWVVMSEQAIAVSDPQRDPRFARTVAETTGYVPSTILAVPVQTERQLLGVVELLDRDERRPDADRDMALLSLFADQAALAIAGERAFRDLGRVLLSAAAAMVEDRTLAEAIDVVAAETPSAQSDVSALAALTAELGRLGEPERALAIAVVRAVTAYASTRARRPG